MDATALGRRLSRALGIDDWLGTFLPVGDADVVRVLLVMGLLLWVLVLVYLVVTLRLRAALRRSLPSLPVDRLTQTAERLRRVDYVMREIPRTAKDIDEVRGRVESDPQLAGFLVTPDQRAALVVLDFWDGVDAHDIYARTDEGAFVNLLKTPAQPLLVVGNEGLLRELSGRISRRRKHQPRRPERPKG